MIPIHPLVRFKQSQTEPALAQQSLQFLNIPLFALDLEALCTSQDLAQSHGIKGKEQKGAVSNAGAPRFHPRPTAASPKERPLTPLPDRGRN